MHELTIRRQAENVKLWQLRDQDPLPTYVKGRALLVGDAAHVSIANQSVCTSLWPLQCSPEPRFWPSTSSCQWHQRRV